MIHFFSLSDAQRAAAARIYSSAYAIGGTNFANLALGVASGEGLAKANLWSSNADRGVTALGPFQLNLNSGVGRDFGLNANSSPDQQLHAALTTMYNGGNYNTGPWAAVGDTFPGGNNSDAGKSGAAAIGARIAAANGLSGSGGGGASPIAGGGSSDFATPDMPSNADLAAMGYSGTPADMQQDYGQDYGGGGGPSAGSGGNFIREMTPEELAAIQLYMISLLAGGIGNATSVRRAAIDFSVIAGTIFENTKKPLRDWYRFIHLMLASKKGISARQVWRYMGFGSLETAWYRYMCHRVRVALMEDIDKLGGIVEIDETFVGGLAKNRHWDKRGGGGGTGGIGSGKTPIVGAVSRKGNVVARVVANVQAHA
jgi:hypothetical protein